MMPAMAMPFLLILLSLTFLIAIIPKIIAVIPKRKPIVGIKEIIPKIKLVIAKPEVDLGSFLFVSIKFSIAN